MGLTVHYSLRLDTLSVRKAREAVAKLRSRALDLPFAEVAPIVEFDGPEYAADLSGHAEQRRWLLCQAGAWLEVGGRHVRVAPTHVIAFSTTPAAGSEAANFGLCRYPATIELREPSTVPAARRVRTKLAGWRWASFCKTQYASNPQCGGLKNFLRCHITLLTLLDHAKSLGLVDEVRDEGGYWENHDPAELAREVGQWNELVAGLAARLKHQLGEGVLAEIAKFPDFEQLAAAGQSAE
jgi:hypothetical protein